MEKIYNYFKKINENSKLSHAFLIGNVFFDECKNEIKKVIEDFFFYEKIDIENNPDIHILLPEGNVVTKDQIKNLLKNLSLTSQIHKNKIYIIPNCENLSESVCNALLKSIEEPEKGIIAILITSNFEKVLDTIKSRCSIIYLNSNSNIEINYNEITLKFIESVEKYGIDAIYKLSEIYKLIENKEMLKDLLEQAFNLYRFSLNLVIEDANYNDEITKIIIKNNTIYKISDKILVLDDLISKSEYYLNKNLMIDKAIIELGRCNNEISVS